MIPRKPASEAVAKEWRRRYQERAIMRFKQAVARAQTDLENDLEFALNATVMNDDSAVWEWHKPTKRGA